MALSRPLLAFLQLGGRDGKRAAYLGAAGCRYFSRCRINVQSDFLAGLAYRYVASRRTRVLLPIYNFIDNVLFNLTLLKPFRPFVLTSGEKLGRPAGHDQVQWKRCRPMNNATPRLDIIIPVYNEGDNIVPTMRGLAAGVKTSNRILICYDREDDDTLPAIRNNREASIS